MNFQDVQGFSLLNLAKINVILGKNGCGKSHILKVMEAQLRNASGFGKVRYISPERGGTIKYDAGIDQTIGNNPNWINDIRRNNQIQNFREQSAALFKRLEMMILREIESSNLQGKISSNSFGVKIEKLNSLLDRVMLVRDNDSGFKIVDKISKADAPAQGISSGEAELISLGIEIMSFAHEAIAGATNVIFIDEPDVHLHPDLQHRLAQYIVDVSKDKELLVVLATHSTALLAGLAENHPCSVAFMRSGDVTLTFEPVSAIDKQILPIFGAHPLSNVFNQAPILLVEGEDDERVWQQGVRSAGGKIRIYPCPVDSIDKLAEYENEVNKLVSAVYDNPKAYSLRDRDVGPAAIDDIGSVIRMRLECRAAENLMLSDDVLVRADTTWTKLQTEIVSWIASNATHKYHAVVKSFADGGFSRKSFDLKDIRNIILGMISSKPWEVIVGQSIAELALNPSPAAEGSLREYLGAKVCNNLLHIV